MSDTEKPALPPRESTPPTNQGTVPSLDADQKYGGRRGARAADDEIERMLAEAMGGMTEAEMFGAPARPQKKIPGGTPGTPQRKKGKIISIHGKDVFVEVPGGRSQGVLPVQQFTDAPPRVGDEVEFTIEGAEDGLLLLSRKGAAMQADWSSVAEGMIVEARVTETNKGGVAVEVNGIRGFMPISQLDIYRVENAEQFVNQRLRCIVTEVNVEDRNLVVSRRALLEKEREETREQTWNALAEGQVREGIVRSIKDFGAFVDLGGVDGLLHIGEMSWNRVDKPEQIVQLGQKVRVMILKIDHERRKLSLGLKQLSASPWDNLAERYPVGSVVNGKVSRLADFGAFVELEPAIEGLIHISELAPQRVYRVRDVVQVGQEVQVLVLSIDPAQRRISLSLKGAAAKAQPAPTPEPEEEEVEEAPKKPPRPRTTPLRGGLGERK